MQCCVPFCKSTAETVSEPAGVTFHEFPSEEHLRAAWLQALGQYSLPDPAVVCSQHFLSDDFCATQSGSRQIRTGAIPTTVQVCMICLDTRSKLLLMSKYKLEEAYRHLVGPPLCDQGNLRQTLCVQCAQRLVNFNKFRDKSLRAQALMTELVEQHEIITMQHMDMLEEANNQLKYNIVKTVSEPDHCDLYINSSDTDTQTDIEATSQAITVKHEERRNSSCLNNTQHIPMSEDNNNTDNFNVQPIAYKEQYMNPSQANQMNDPLLITPTSIEKGLEPLAPIKQEIIVCSTCMMEFADEDMYAHHTAMHMETNHNSDEYLIPDYCPSSVAAMDESLVTNQRIIHPTEETNEIETNANEMAGQKIKIEIEVDTRMSENDSLPNKHISREKNIYPGKDAVNIEIIEPRFPKQVRQKSNYNYSGSNSDEEFKFPCTLCNFKTNTGKKLQSHIDAHLKKNDIKIIFGCDHCDYITKSKNDLIKHLTVHADDKPFTCTLCDYKSTKPVLLQNHMRKHTGEKPFSCVFCDYKCGSKSSLKKHRKTHAGERSFSCKFCEYKCSQSGFLLRHLRTHTGDRPFSCELCPHKCSRRSDLVRHIKTHTGEKPYSCSLCDYKCMRSSDLRRHSRTHTGEKPYSCDMCQFKCARRCALAQHRCKYRCSRRSDLARHKRTHTGEKPFTCDVCHFKCAQRSGLVQHIIRNHSKSIKIEAD